VDPKRDCPAHMTNDGDESKGIGPLYFNGLTIASTIRHGFATDCDRYGVAFGFPRSQLSAIANR